MAFYQSLTTFTELPEAKQRQWAVGGFFALLLLVGVFIFKDYGVSWDESIDRINGLVNAKYMLDQVAPEWVSQQALLVNVPEFHSHEEVDHGALFHLPFAFIEIMAGGIDSRTYYLIRHFSIFLSFVLGTWALYKIALIRFQSWKLGLLAAALLVLSPRIFADAFYNGKDLVFMAFFTVAVYTLVRLLERPTVGAAVLHGLATAIATDMRILGCMLFALSLGMFVLEAIYATDSRRRSLLLKVFGVYCVATVAFTIMGWPFLWEKPFMKFALAFEKMRRFRWEGSLLYLGEEIMGTNLPWHYTPVWIAISTPVAYTLACVIGALAYVYALLRSGLGTLRTFAGRLDLLFSGWFVLPILMIIVLHSVIYDGWRHMYFVYPGLLLLAVRGVAWLWEVSRSHALLRRVALGLALLAGAEAVLTTGRMVASHPHQQVYYSFLSAEQAGDLFERDYWGLSFRKGLEWILAHDSASTIPVDCAFPILLENNMAILKPEDRSRLQIKPGDRNAYYFASYRTHPQAYPDSMGSELHSIYTNGIKILSVYHRW
ncbi:hypothetical protein [Hymenobacter cellulosilyticus]|uniref:Glycosyltransferase RgtA/B/C/D-like domain-containing protein n=1 Tax=Hymenobacter cellulosilyticus TaxID=2932248 RepID=A0A8T9Q381_9BACT|nr:hypothetical protein [Hymenobacter cellulosilyticus]UOQ71994.1 hypothetical protein MUN79_25965 [Hymenobacter cellulosilyticus]